MKLNTKLAFLFIILICLPVVIPYFRERYFPTHDGEWAVVRLADMYRSIKDWQLPVRFSGYLNSGYGYPLFNFAYPFPYYLGLLPLFLGFGLVGSIKLIFVLSVFFSAFFMFLLAKKIWKSDFAGLISGLFYVYLPYRMVDLYVRGSIGESLSLAIFPFIFYLVYKIYQNQGGVLPIVLAGTGWGVLIMTHNIMAVLFTPFLLLFCLILYKQTGSKKQFAKSAISVFIFGLLISCFFWLPALAEKSLIRLSQIPIADRSLYFVSLKQFILPSWGFAPPTETNGFTYQLGWPQLLILILVFISSFFTAGNKKTGFLVKTLLFGLLVSIVMLFKPTAILWRNIPFLKEINYPWTLLAPVGFITSLLAGYLVTQGKFSKLSGIFLAAAAIILVVPYAKPSAFVNRGDDYYLTNQATTTSSNELMPLWVKEKPLSYFKEKVETEPKVNINNLKYDSRQISFSFQTKKNAKITINTLFYPGWRIFANGREMIVNHDNKFGVMEFTVPSGNYQMNGRFSETVMRFFSDIISGLAILVLIVLISKQTIVNLLKKKEQA